MGNSDLLKKISEAGVPIMHSKTWNQQGFAFQVASERLLLNKEDDGNPMASVLASVGKDTDAAKYSVFDNAFDAANDDSEPIAIFKEPIHDHLVYFGDKLAALSRLDNKTLIDVGGNELAKFRYAVHPQILEMPDGSYAALGLNRQDITGTNGNNYPGFKEPVFATLVYLGDKHFAAIQRNSYESAVVSNGARMDTLGKFPIFNDKYPSIGHKDENTGNGRIVKVGDRFAGIDWSDKQAILHTVADGEEHIPYGRFPVEVNPETLITEKHIFVAVDYTLGTRVYALHLDDLAEMCSDGNRVNIHQPLEQGIDTGNHILMVPYKQLKKILSE